MFNWFYFAALISGFAAQAASLPLDLPIYPGATWEVNDSYRARALPLSQLEDFLFPANPSERSPATDGIVIIKGGKIIYERYDHNYGPEKRHAFWSISKSIFSAVYGAALADGKLKNEDSVCARLAQKDAKICAIRNIDLLQHSSGLEWAETYENSSRPKDSSVIALLYGGGTKDATNFVLSLHQPSHPPGTHWNYSSGDSNLLAGVFRIALGEEAAAYPWKRIFSPLGIQSFIWETDEKGSLIASSYLHGTPRDLARVGLLFLREGKWAGQDILPSNWIRFSTTMAPALRTTKQIVAPGREPNMYGAHWWLNLANPDQGLGKPWPNQPENVYAALGHWGQSMIILPSEDLVIVRMANDRRDRLPLDRFLSLVREFAQ